MKNLLKAFFVFVLILFFYQCKNFSMDSERLKSISVSETNDLINRTKDLVILDVRTPDEYNSGHIINSINIDFYKESFSSDLEKLDKKKTYLVYCRSGNRSSQALPIMEDLGFLKVYNMIGGIIEWNEEGFPLE